MKKRVEPAEGIEVILEYEDSPTAQTRLSQAFRIILDEIDEKDRRAEKEATAG